MNKTWHNFLACGILKETLQSEQQQKIENSQQTPMLRLSAREKQFKKRNSKKKGFCICMAFECLAGPENFNLKW